MADSAVCLSPSGFAADAQHCAISAASREG